MIIEDLNFLINTTKEEKKKKQFNNASFPPMLGVPSFYALLYFYNQCTVRTSK